MRHKIAAILFAILLTPVSLQAQKAGDILTEREVEQKGIDRFFVKEKISDSLFKRINGKSYKKGCTVSTADLRYLRLLHYTIDHRIKVGELVCSKDIADDLIDIFRKLFSAKYPIERMQLIDDYNADDNLSMEHNNTTCFNYRVVAGSKKLSKHSLGKAVDLNPLYNPYVKKRTDGTTVVNPKNGRRYTDRNKNFNYKINRSDLAYKLFVQHGFRWGGSWRTLKDYQHFEK